MLWFRLRRLLAILVIAGLTFGPFAASAATGTAELSQMAAMEMAHHDEAMGDMPCCPDEKPALPDCQKLCPLMMSCLAKTVQAAPAAWAMVPVAALTEIVRPWDDARRDGLAKAPPPRPPRT